MHLFHAPTLTLTSTLFSSPASRYPLAHTNLADPWLFGYQIASEGHDWAWEQETVARGMSSGYALSQGMAGSGSDSAQEVLVGGLASWECAQPTRGCFSSLSFSSLFLGWSYSQAQNKKSESGVFNTLSANLITAKPYLCISMCLT